MFYDAVTPPAEVTLDDQPASFSPSARLLGHVRRYLPDE
jgi:hypothetical protein